MRDDLGAGQADELEVVREGPEGGRVAQAEINNPAATEPARKLPDERINGRLDSYFALPDDCRRPLLLVLTMAFLCS